MPLNGDNMIAVDTNVIVRFLTRDDEAQYLKAYRIFAESALLFIPTTVILETEWVLRFSYRFPSDRIGYALSGLLGLTNVMTENKAAVFNALAWHQQGMDFADALHLACSSSANEFVSFDKKLINKAIGLNVDIKLIDLSTLSG